MTINVLQTREVLMCVHKLPVTDCEICLAELAGYYEVPVIPVTTLREIFKIPVIEEE